MTIQIGTSGWVYPHWHEIFYPLEIKKKDWFSYYAGQFSTVEINNTFYRLPSETAFDKWCDQAPPGFIYAVKASRYLTHLKKLKDPEQPLALFFERATRLGEALGPILYQLPPRWKVNLDRLESFLKALPKPCCHVFEFRDSSWLIDDVFQMLKHYEISFCIHDMPPLQVPWPVTASPVYIRLHGDANHAGNYQHAYLESLAGRINDWHDKGLDVFVYFNNDVFGHAINNARTLNQLLHPHNV